MSSNFLSTKKGWSPFHLFECPRFLTQMKERSIQTLGYLPVGDGDFPHQKKLLQGLMDSVEVGSSCLPAAL